MSLSIHQPNSLPSIVPTRVTSEDLAQMVPEGSFATRQIASTATNETAVEVTTVQGDKVTLTFCSSLVNYTYLRPEGMDVPDLIDAQVSSENMGIETQRELSREEQDDIAALQKDLAALISSSPETDNISQSLLSGYDTLSSLSLNVQAEKTRASADEMTIVPDPAYTAWKAKQTVNFLKNSMQADATANYLSLIV